MNVITLISEARRYGTVDLEDGRLVIDRRFPKPTGVRTDQAARRLAHVPDGRSQ